MTTSSSVATSWAVDLAQVTKKYRHFQLQPISLQIPRGCVAGLIGPNGAGKSTTMRMMMGLVRPDSGSVEVLGHPMSASNGIAKLDVGYFSEDMRLYKAESIGWHQEFVQSLYPTWDEAYARELLAKFGLVAEQKVKGLSHGQRVKAMLLLILARRPQLLILDEPTNGLDPVAKQEVLRELMRVVEDDQRTLLFSSHDTQDVEQISDSITFIDRGRVVASQDRDRFLEQWRRIKVQAAETWSPPPLPGLHLESSFRSLRVFTHDQFTPQISAALTAAGATIEAIESMTLAEIFVSAVQRGREGN